MFYREKQSTIHVNFVMDQGGIGDCIGSLPAIKYVYDAHPHVVIHQWVPDYFVDFAKRSLPVDKQRIITRGFSEKHKFKKELYGRGYAMHIHTNLAYHLVDHAFNVLVNKQVENSLKNYLPVRLDGVDVDRFYLPKKFVVVTTGFTAPVREFLPEYVNKVIEYIRGKGYSVVFLGKERSFNGDSHTIKGIFREEIDYSQGLNLINKTDLIESAKVIQRAHVIVGLDNGLLHVAGCTGDIPIVGGFTTVEPRYRMPYRHDELGYNYYPVVPPESLACRFCQSNLVFTYNHDFVGCYYKDFLCTKQLRAELYIEQLEKVL